MPPEISVVIPVYRRGRAIAETVASVLAQDIAPEQFELVIVDDGSPDDTWAILRELYGQHHQIRLFQIPNGGVAGARNFGLEQARGEYIAYLDHDDLWLPAKLRLQAEILRAQPAVGVVYCNWLVVEESGQAAPRGAQVTTQWWWSPAQGEVYPWILMPHRAEYLRNPLSSMSFPLVRTALLREIGGFDPKMVPSDDWDLWIRLSQRTRFAYLPAVLAHYVLHSSQQHRDSQAAWDSWRRLFAKHPASWLRHPLVRAKQLSIEGYFVSLKQYSRAKDALVEGQKPRVLAATLRAIWASPLTLTRREWMYLWLRLLKNDRRPF